MTSLSPASARPATVLRVSCRNSAGLLRQMSGIFATHGINILSLQASTSEDFKGQCTFGVAERAGDRLARLVADLRRLRDVVDVTTEPRVD